MFSIRLKIRQMCRQKTSVPEEKHYSHIGYGTFQRYTAKVADVMSALRDDRLEYDPECDSLGRLVDPTRWRHMQALLNGMWATQQFQWRKPRLCEFLSQEPPFNYTCLCMYICAYNDYAVRAIMRFMWHCAAHEHAIFRKFFGVDDSIRDAVKTKWKAGLVPFREGITKFISFGNENAVKKVGKNKRYII